MLTYNITNRGNESLYEYLYNCIKNDIITGLLSPNEKLPSKRVFASNHGISIVTVENTYNQLIAEGYIYSKPKSGFYVSAIDSRIYTSTGSKANVKITIPAPSVPAEENIYNLVSNHTSPDNFPFSIWAKIIRRLLSDQDSKLLTSPPPGGAIELRTAIAQHLSDFRGIFCEPEQIIIGAGAEYLYSIIVQLLGRDKVYGLENPGSKKIKNIYEALGVRVTPLSMDSEGIELSKDNLSLPDIIHISPSHHFPTGIVTSIGRRYGLLQWANEADERYIIEDDYDSEFRLQGKPISSLFSIDQTDKVIYFNTFTKSLASTIRISYMVLPKSLLELYYTKLGFYSCTVSNFEQYTLASFINENYFEKHINRMRNQYRETRDRLIDEFELSKLSKYIFISEENAGLHFLLHINTTKADDFLKEKARDKGIAVSFISDYYAFTSKHSGDDNSHTVIINYSAINSYDIPQIVSNLESAWLPVLDKDSDK